MGLFSRFRPKNPDQAPKASPEQAPKQAPPAAQPAAAAPAPAAPAPVAPAHKPRRSTMRPEAPAFKIAGEELAKSRGTDGPRPSHPSQMSLEQLAARALQAQQNGEVEGDSQPQKGAPPPYAPPPRDGIKGQAPRPVRRSAPPRTASASRPRIDPPTPPAPRRPLPSAPTSERLDKPAAPQRAPLPATQVKSGAVDPPRTVIRSAKAAAPTPPTRPRETFATLAPRYLEPVRSLVIGLQWSEPVAEWLSAARSAASSLRTALVDAGVGESARELEELAVALRNAEVDADGVARDSALQAILVAYAKLAADVPALAVEETQQRREAVIVEALLSQVSGMNTNTIDKLRASGRARLAVLGRSPAEDLANASGIGSGLASQIVERLKRYRADLRHMPLGALGPAGRERLTALLRRLRETHDQYQEATNSFSDAGTARKKQLREDRNDALHDIRIMLARGGELERLAEIEKLPFDGKIERLESYLSEIVTTDATTKAPRQSGDKVR
jgi:hypothetical protein